MALNKTEKQLLDETHAGMIKIKTVLLGANGDNGICGDVARNSKAISNLKKTLYILIGVLMGVSIVYGGTLGISSLISG